MDSSNLPPPISKFVEMGEEKKRHEASKRNIACGLAMSQTLEAARECLESAFNLATHMTQELSGPIAEADLKHRVSTRKYGLSMSHLASQLRLAMAMSCYALTEEDTAKSLGVSKKDFLMIYEVLGWRWKGGAKPI